MKRTGLALVLTCEHGGHRVPPALADAFRSADARAALVSHRGWDPGALTVAHALARRLGVPLVAARISRLVVELNRSPHHPRLWSTFTRTLPPAVRDRLRATIYQPHHARVRACLAAALESHRRVLHVAVHSFTPILDGQVREAEIGLLYDPKRVAERAFAAAWQADLASRLPGLRIRRNYPYHGASDGLTTMLRREFPAGRYLGFELELNQQMLRRRDSQHHQLVAALAATLQAGLRARRDPRS